MQGEAAGDAQEAQEAQGAQEEDSSGLQGAPGESLLDLARDRHVEFGGDPGQLKALDEPLILLVIGFLKASELLQFVLTCRRIHYVVEQFSKEIFKGLCCNAAGAKPEEVVIRAEGLLGHDWRRVFILLKQTVWDAAGELQESPRATESNENEGEELETCWEINAKGAIRPKRNVYWSSSSSPGDWRIDDDGFISHQGAPGTNSTILFKPFTFDVKQSQRVVALKNLHTTNLEFQVARGNYFEISLRAPPNGYDEVFHGHYDRCIAIGFSGKFSPPSRGRMIGWEKSSLAWHSDDGKFFWNAAFGHLIKNRNLRFDATSCKRVGIGLHFPDDCTFYVFFTRDGELLAMTSLPRKAFPWTRIIPAVGVDSDEAFKVHIDELLFDEEGFRRTLANDFRSLEKFAFPYSRS